ncbi:MAG TPA: AAA family ATPase [Xanthobacteraceae bacterium]|nr:AAA family ATPase [Xanthobacteraceae bacterium]
MKSATLDPRWSAAMASRQFGAAAPPPVPAAPAVTAVVSAVRADDVLLGDADIGGAVGLSLPKLLEGRLLIQGASGAGKSWTLRRLLEQSARSVQQVIIDPEGEFRALADAFGHLTLEGHRLDAAALALAARRAREHRLSVLVDVSELDRDGQMKAIAAVFTALIEAPREHWHPVIVAVDEAHLFAPFGGQAAGETAVRKAAIAAVTDLMSRGRKRGLCGVLATQRLARLAKSVVSEAQNFLIGLNTLDLDIRRAAETIGWDSRRAFDRLPMLTPGDFVGVGPALSRSPAVVRIGAIQTEHKGAAPTLPPALRVAPGEAAALLDLDALLEASQRDAEVRAGAPLHPGLKAVRAFIRDAAFPDAGRIWAALRDLAPDGAAIADLGSHLAIEASAVTAALALLDSFGVVDFDGDGPGAAVRIARDMRP